MNKEITAKIIEGDEAAFKLSYNYFFPKLFFFVKEYVGSDDIAENIVQETFLTLWNKKSVINLDTNLSAYLYTVAKNNCLNKLRNQRLRNQIINTTSNSEIEMVLNEQALNTLDTSELTFFEIERIIEETIELLPEQCKKVFLLSRFDNKKNREIAQELGISQKTVEGHISKALKLFRTSLHDYLPIVAFLFIID